MPNEIADDVREVEIAMLVKSVSDVLTGLTARGGEFHIQIQEVPQATGDFPLHSVDY